MSQGHIKTGARAIAVNPSSGRRLGALETLLLHQPTLFLDGAVISSLEEPESGTQTITSVYVWLIRPSSEDLPLSWTQTATNAVQ